MPNLSNNDNAPGTNPPVDNSAAARVHEANQIVNTKVNITGNPKAPVASDPFNGGIPSTSASEITADIEIDDELGGTGTLIVGGILSGADYNPDLSGRERTLVYDRMRKGDATVRLALAAVKYPIFSTSWYIRHGKTEEDGGPMTEFIREELFNNPNFSFTQFMHQAFLFVDYGNSFHEKVFRWRADGKIGWKKFAPRLPHTVYRYTLQDGITPGITQILPVGGIVEIPQWKLLSFILELEGSNYEGSSLLRSMHKHWFYKDVYYKIDSIASERQGMGVPVIHVPPQASPQDKARAKTIAKNMRTNEIAYLDLPIGFEVEYIDTKAKELKEVKEMVAHHDRQILKAAMAHFLDLGGTGGSGARALGESQMDFFVLSEQYIAKTFQEPVNLAIRELIDLNFSTKNLAPDEYPTLEYGDIAKTDLAKLSEALKNFVDSGILLPDDDLERHIRQTADLPESMKSDAKNPTDWQARTMKMTNPNGFSSNNPTPEPSKPNGERKMGKTEFSENFEQLTEELDQIIKMKDNDN